MLFLAKLIPRVCHNVNRVCYIFGPQLHHPIQDITPTYLTSNVIATLRQADHLANQVFAAYSCMDAISQMPVVLIPVHFDRDAACRTLSCQRSIVLRPFCTSDFMTGTPAIPGKDLPIHVSLRGSSLPVIYLQNVSTRICITFAHILFGINLFIISDILRIIAIVFILHTTIIVFFSFLFSLFPLS